MVGILLALKRSGISMDPQAMKGWVLAHGWSGSNPANLAEYVDQIRGLLHG